MQYIVFLAVRQPLKSVNANHMDHTIICMPKHGKLIVMRLTDLSGGWTHVWRICSAQKSGQGVGIIISAMVHTPIDNEDLDMATQYSMQHSATGIEGMRIHLVLCYGTYPH